MTKRKPWKICAECAGRYRAGQKAGHIAAGHQDWFEGTK
jgi:hypothetical protein